jgi:hypothetical protein
MSVDYDEETFTYTHEYTVDSSVIEGIYYNANDKTLVLDVNEEYYLWQPVLKADVDALANAESVGAHFNTVWKNRFGKGEHLGNWYDWDEQYETDRNDYTQAVQVETPQEAFDRVKQRADAALATAGDTKEYSLQPLPAAGVTSDVEGASTVVYFNLPDVGEKEFQFTASTSDVYEAVEELHQYVSRIGQRGSVKRVVVEFG